MKDMNTVRLIKLMLLLVSIALLGYALSSLLEGGDIKAAHGFASAWCAWCMQYYFCRFMGWSSYFAYLSVDSDKEHPRLHLYDAIVAIGPILIFFAMNR